MAGILYHGEDGFPLFTDRDGNTSTVPLPPGINHPLNICSSSHGLVVFQDPISYIYYIGNPRYFDSYISLPQPPRQHDPLHTHVVLDTELVEPPRYHIVCAVEDFTRTTYTFDMYSSCIGRWLSYTGVDVGAHIIPNTGVSCNVYAYWLTESPWSIIRFNIYFPLTSNRLRFPDAVLSSALVMRIQLGRIGNTMALLSVLDEGSPHFLATMYLSPDGNPPQWQRFSAELPLPTISWPTPRPIRFESQDFEVFFWVSGQLMRWRTTLNAGETGSLDMLREEGVRAADGIALVFSTLHPQDFPVLFRIRQR